MLCYMTAPGAPPTYVRIVEELANSVNVSWMPGPYPNGVITGYEVEVKVSHSSSRCTDQL